MLGLRVNRPGSTNFDIGVRIISNIDVSYRGCAVKDQQVLVAICKVINEILVKMDSPVEISQRLGEPSATVLQKARTWPQASVLIDLHVDAVVTSPFGWAFVGSEAMPRTSFPV